MLRRGFKSQCERRSTELRKRLGLGTTSPLLAKELAKHVGGTVWSASEIEGLIEEDLNQLTKYDGDSWSASLLRPREVFNRKYQRF